MKKGIWAISAMSFLTLLNVAKGESGQSTAVAPAPAPAASESKIIGGVDIRPSWTTLTGEMHNENSVLAGYQFNSKVSSFALYNFNNNLFDPTDSVHGLQMSSIDLSLRTPVNKIYTEPNTGIVFSYENRLYFPVNDSDFDKGKILVIRNYAKLARPIGERFKLTLMDVPIVHLFKAAGTVSASGSASANPFFENRVYLIGDVTLTKDLALSVPVYWHVTWYRDFESGAASNNAATSHYVYVYPELTYTINDNFAVAAAYYSDNLVKADLSDTDINAGLEHGVFQVSFQANL